MNCSAKHFELMSSVILAKTNYIMTPIMF